MKALVVSPGRPGVRLEDVPEPQAGPDDVLVQMLALGICGTDREIIDGQFGTAPPGRDRLVLGHESLGRVLQAPPGSGLDAGDLVVGIVRTPDPEPCANCAAGEWDMCRNGRYTEHGIKALDGFGAEQVVLSAALTVKIDPVLGTGGVLLEPTSIVAKAWEQIERIGARAHWSPQRVLITGAGPVGLLGALLGVQRGLDVHVFDRNTTGQKPALVESLGATYHTGDVKDVCDDADVLIECTGAGELVLDALECMGPNGIACLTGLSSSQRDITCDPSRLNRELVLGNGVVFGTVNANRRHYEQAAAALAAAPRAWLEGLITRQVPLGDWYSAFERQPGDVKVVIEYVGLS